MALLVIVNVARPVAMSRIRNRAEPMLISYAVYQQCFGGSMSKATKQATQKNYEHILRKTN